MKNFIIFLFVLIPFLIQAQKSYKVIYHRIEKGKIDSSSSVSIIYFDNGITSILSSNSKAKEFIDYNRNLTVNIIEFDKHKFKTIQSIDSLYKPVFNDETENILGFKCKKATFKAFSNTIEVWYTNKAKAKGSPYKSYLPKDALVLKIMINGGTILIATEIQKTSNIISLDYQFEQAKTIGNAEYREKIIKARYSIIPVFNKEQINFESDIKNPKPNQLDSIYRFERGNIILKKIKLTKEIKNGAYIFATVSEWSNGDAYDRLGSIFIVKESNKGSIIDALFNSEDLSKIIADSIEKYFGLASSNNYTVPTELIRFITPFGVSNFNNTRPINNYHWADSVVYKADVTSLIPDNKDEIWIGAFIGNYDKGGHNLSLQLDVYPAWEDDKPKKKFTYPLFNSINSNIVSNKHYNRLFADDTLITEFEIPDSIEKLQLVFTTTGHGGWGGGDEFNPKLNQVFVDGKLVLSHIPWRNDCATYRLSNPASGNFENGLSSSDINRSNWCPGTMTVPYYIPLNNLKAGKHKIEVIIDQGKEDGNSWSVSGCIIGNYKE